MRVGSKNQMKQLKAVEMRNRLQPHDNTERQQRGTKPVKQEVTYPERGVVCNGIKDVHLHVFMVMSPYGARSDSCRPCIHSADSG